MNEVEKDKINVQILELRYELEDLGNNLEDIGRNFLDKFSMPKVVFGKKNMYYTLSTVA